MAQAPSNEHEKKQTDLDQGEIYVRLLMEHEPRVRAFLRGLLPTWNDVDEVTQEASLIAWRKFDQFEQGTAFGGWFLTIARFEALKHRKKIAKSPLVFNDDIWKLLADEAESDRSSAGMQKYLELCLNTLAPDKKELMLKAHSPGVVTRELAQQSNKSEAAFYKIIQRLRAVLLKCISNSMAAEGAR